MGFFPFRLDVHIVICWKIEAAGKIDADIAVTKDDEFPDLPMYWLRPCVLAFLPNGRENTYFSEASRTDG